MQTVTHGLWSCVCAYVPVHALSTCGAQVLLKAPAPIPASSHSWPLLSSGLPEDSPLFPGDFPGPLVEQQAPPSPPCRMSLRCRCLGRVPVPSSCSSRTFWRAGAEPVLLPQYLQHLRGAQCSLGSSDAPAYPPGATLGTRTTGEREEGLRWGGASRDVQVPLSSLHSREYHTL